MEYYSNFWAGVRSGVYSDFCQSTIALVFSRLITTEVCQCSNHQHSLLFMQFQKVASELVLLLCGYVAAFKTAAAAD